MTPLFETTWEHWDRLCRAWKGILSDLDADSVHDVRVASRRLRSTLTLLEAVLQENRPLKARRHIKRLMNKLGALRDVQVYLSIAEKWGAQDAVSGFINSLKRVERTEGRKVREYLTADRQRKIRRSLKTLERHAEPLLKALSPATIRRRTQAALKAQRADLKAAEANKIASDPQSLHRLRVAAKKLRYSLEAARPILGRASRAELHRLRGYQTALGNKRDLQMLEKKFQQWRKKHPGPRRRSVRDTSASRTIIRT